MVSAQSTQPTCTTGYNKMVTNVATLNNLPNEAACPPGVLPKFLYNVNWGPPNEKRPTSTITDSTTIANLEWTANITCSTARPNGMPTGCCTTAGGAMYPTTSNFLAGCTNCISTSVSALIARGSLATKNAAVAGSTVSTWTPQYNQLTTSAAAQGGVSLLRFPTSASSASLAAGVYTFQLWAESLCGKTASKNVTLVARCPPSPMVMAVVRTTASTSTLYDFVDGKWQVPISTAVRVDASCSHAWPINKPGSWTGNHALYAVKTVYFSQPTDQAAASILSIATASVSGTGTSYTSDVTMQSKGEGKVVITVTDGCSVSQGYITLMADCNCQPKAKAKYSSTVWTNVMSNFYGSSSTLNSKMNNAQPFTDGGNGKNSAELSFKLDGSGSSDFDVSTLSLDYDWSFVSWAPDYSQTFGMAPITANGRTMSPFLNNLNSNILSGTFPPSGDACKNPKTSEMPAACANSMWGLSTAACCFAGAMGSTMNDQTDNLGMVQRGAIGQYVFKVLQTIEPATNGIPTPIRSWTSGTRTKTYSFMRLSGACPAVTQGAGWMTVSTNTTSSTNSYTYYALPKLTMMSQVRAAGANEIPEGDFNSFPGINGVSGQPTSAGFRPTTSCTAWLQTVKTVSQLSRVQTRENRTSTCSNENDLLLCRVTIVQTGGWNTASGKLADLKVSSFGACRGFWTFALTVGDTCKTDMDVFSLRVGCNRAPGVSAGCSNAQTYNGQKFQQITLDGRASFDPDNFGDPFYNLAAQSNLGKYPQCIGSGGCSNWGVGQYGLTYAWALMSGPGYTKIGDTCPWLNTSQTNNCVETYCSASFMAYPTIDLRTNMYNIPSTWPRDARGPSPQGDTTLYTAFQSTMKSYTPILGMSNSTRNTQPTLASGTATTVNMKIFPMFNSMCAPTVMPIWSSTTFATGNQLEDTSTTPNTNLGIVAAPNAVGNDRNTWWRVQEQLQHVGSVAYIPALTQEGTYTVRLYAFDGCSVSWGDVTFTTMCPTITFPALPFNDLGISVGARFNLSTTYVSNDHTSTKYIFPSQIAVYYDGLPNNVISGTVRVYMKSTTTGSWNMVTAGGHQCDLVQDIAKSGARILKPSSSGACDNIIYTGTGNGASNDLTPGDYSMQVQATDNCGSNRLALVYYNFTVTCPLQAEVNWNTSNSQSPQNSGFPASFTYQYVAPLNSASGTAKYTGTFPSVQVPVTAVARNSSGGTVSDNVVFMWSVSWSGASATSLPGNLAVDQSGVPFYAVNDWTNKQWPTTAISPNTQPSAFPAGEQVIRFGGSSSTTTKPLSFGYLGSTANPATSNIQKNVLLSSVQALFPATSSNLLVSPFHQKGTYKIMGYAQAENQGCSISTNHNTQSKQSVYYFVVMNCADLTDPRASVRPSSGALGAYFQDVQYTLSQSYCAANNDPYCQITGGSSSVGRFNKLSLTAQDWYTNRTQGLVGGFAMSENTATKGTTVSFAVSYMGAAAVANTTSGGTYLIQNALAISPTAWTGNSRSTSFTPPVMNAEPTEIQLNMPGTWHLDIYGTDGCANITSTDGYNLYYSCPQSTMPSANMTFQVTAGVGSTTEQDVTANRVFYCGITPSTGEAPKPVTGQTVVIQSSNRRRRRLLEDDEEVEGPMRHLLQASNTAVKALANTLCSQNGNYFSAPAQGILKDRNGNDAASAGASSTSARVFGAPNWQAYIPIYFDSFDIQPGYVPNSTDLRNWFGMGSLFTEGSSSKVTFGLGWGLNGAQYYQGRWEQAKMTIPTATNNKKMQWYSISNWVGEYTSSTAGGNRPTTWTMNAPAWTSSANTFNGAKFDTSFCFVANQVRYGNGNQALLPISASNNPSSGGYQPAGQATTMMVYGCSPFGLGGMSVTTSISSANVMTFNGPTAYAAPGTGFAGGNMPSAADKGGVLMTKEGITDYQVLVWNGAQGASCYDYRAVRIYARCNVLQGVSSTATGTATTLGAPTVPGAQTSNWNGVKFSTVELTSTFSYRQCGATGTNDACGAKANTDGKGNLYSLVYSWNVLSSPAGSWYMMGNTGSGYGVTSSGGTSFTYGAEVLNNTYTSGNEIVTVYKRTGTSELTTYSNNVKLVNHAFNLPKTCIRPDVAGMYMVQLEIDDGCTRWRSDSITISAGCGEMPTNANVWGTTKGYTASGKTFDISTTTGGATVTVMGNTFDRVTLSNAVVPTKTSTVSHYYTYNWALTTGTGAGVNLMNTQGNVVSFVPVEQDASTKVNGLDQFDYVLTLTINSNCMMSNNSNTPFMQKQTYTFTISVLCDDQITQEMFLFGMPYVSTATGTSGTPSQAKYWGSPSSSSIIPSTYYNRRSLVSDSTNTVYSGMAYQCKMGVSTFCGPIASGATSVGAPTILYGGSVATSSTSYSNPGWQGYYFSLPGTLDGSSTTKAACKVKKTYWVLADYQNSYNFMPNWVPINVPVTPAATCNVTQKWSWTITKTPCGQCASTGNAADALTDVCQFEQYSQYQLLSGSSNSVNSGYSKPMFYDVTNAASPSVINPICVYKHGGRLFRDANATTLMQNCDTSGRGLMVWVTDDRNNPSATCSGSNTVSQTATTSSISAKTCPNKYIKFVPSFPGTYELTFTVFDSCAPPVMKVATVNAMCAASPRVWQVKTNITSYYACEGSGNLNVFGDKSRTSATPLPGKFTPVALMDFISTVSGNGTAPTGGLMTYKGLCGVQAVTTTKNCTGLRLQVQNDASLQVDTTGTGGSDKLKACCNCLYGQSTINVFSVPSGTSGRKEPPVNPVEPVQPTTNVLALSEGEYNKNYIILVAIVAPLAVILVASLAGNVLMALKMRQAGGQAFNVRAGDVELSNAPRARVDV